VLPEDFAKLTTYWRSIARGRDFSVHAVARERRDLAIPRSEDAVQRQGGFVLDFKMFSNVSLNLLVELTGAGVLALVEALTGLGWTVEVQPDPAALAGRAAERLEGTFQVTFPEGDGELVIPTPAVPG
jgi:hypothetical protein